MAEPSNFSKLVPGFEFLQSLAKTAGSTLPNMGQWVAPTMNPEELEKRINELRTVQFWLEQNAKMIGATIQALEVQRMTLSTLKTMNVQMGDLRDSLMIKPPAPPAPAPASPWQTRSEAPSDGANAPAGNPQAVDPMQWWAALTRQFTELAASTMKDSADKATETMNAMRPSAADSKPESAAASSGAGSTSAAEAAANEAAKSRRTAARKSSPR